MAKQLHLVGHLSPADVTAAGEAAVSDNERLRWRVLACVAAGQPTHEVQRATGYSACWIGRLVRRYNRGGPSAMADGRRTLAPVRQAALEAEFKRSTQADGQPCPAAEAPAGPPPRRAASYLAQPALSYAGLRRAAYPSDLSDEEWAQLEPWLPPAPRVGRPRQVPLREVVNGLCYILRSGESWRMMPHDLPPWRTVYGYFRAWLADGTLERLNTVLRTKLRASQGRDPCPSAAVIDSQSTKTSEKGGRAATTAGRR